MPDAGYFGLTYELLFEGDAGWTDITPLVDSRQTKVDIAGCSDSLKSVIGKCTIEMRYGTNPAKVTHSTIVGKLLTAKSELQTVRFRMGGIFTFVGKVDLGNFSQKNGRIPGFVTVTVEDNSYLLDEKMDTSFEYPANDDLDDTGWAVFDKNNLAQSIVMLRFLDAGYTIDQIDLTASDSITEKVRRVVYDADDERTYRDFIDTLLYEHCAVLYTTPEGKLSVRRLYKESPTSERSLDHFLVNDGIETSGGDYAYDGVKVVWSNLSRLDGAVVYNANITLELDDEGNRVGEEIQPHHYWPEDGDIEETWQEFDATFLDRPYQTKQSRLKNKDLSLISVKNAYYEVDKDPEILLANNPPEIEPTKARVLWWNSHSTDVKKLYGFTIVGDALFRSKLNETTYPIDAKRLDEPYETEFVYTSEVATRLANHLHRFRKYGDLQHKWAEINVDTPMFQVVTVSAPDTLISSLAMVISQSITFPAPNKVKRANSAIGITAFNSEPVRTRSTQLGGAPVNTGPAGSSGTRSVVQFILGTADAPYSDAGTVVGTSLGRVGTSLALVGVEGAEWSYDAPTPGEGEYVWRREGYYTPPEVWPKVWNITRMTGDKGEQGPQGLQGLQGPQGDQGIQGPAGADGATAYSHIAYADDAEGTGFSQDPTGKAYIGFYADHTEADSEDPADYAWSLIKGADGAQGIPGPAGADGLTAYFHTAWANSSDGTTDFSTTESAGKMYIGTYSDNTQADSTNPSSYKWVKIKGDTGEAGADAKSVSISAPDLFWHFTGRGALTDAAQAITLTANAVNFTPASYQWYRNNTAISGATTATYTVPSGETGVYKVIVDGTYPASVTVGSVTDGASEGMYLGILTTASDAASWTTAYGGYKVPSGIFEGQNLIAGDYYVYNNGGQVTNYYFNGANFEIASGDKLSLFTNAFWDVMNLGTTQASGSFYTLFAQYFMAMEAVIVALGASQIHIQTLSGKSGCIYAGAYNADGVLTDTDGAGFWLGESGQLKANYGEFLGSLRTGADAPTGARVSIKDRTGIVSGPTFSGSGTDDLSVVKDGTIAGDYIVKVTGKDVDTGTDLGFDNVSWSTPVQNGGYNWRSIAVSNATCVMVGEDGYWSRSTDGGVTWSTPVQNGNLTWYSIAVSGTTWVMVGGSGYWSRSTDDGVSWSTPVKNGDYYWLGIAVSGTTWVMVRDGYWSRSTDNGVSWSTPVKNGDYFWQGIAVSGTTWVMFCDGGYWSRSTDNGATWSTPVQNGNLVWNSIAVSNATWVMVGRNGYWSRSTDGGVTWSTPVQNGNLTWYSIAVSGTTWVMVGGSGYWSRSTDDGVSWSTPVKNGDYSWRSIAVSNATWVMVGEHGYWSRKQHNVYADTFAWSKDSGDFSDDISMYPIRNITIGTDIVIRFPAYTGHVVGDTWSFTQEAIYGLKIADKDGNVYVKAGNGVFTLGDSLRSSTEAVFTANLLPLVDADSEGNGEDIGTDSHRYRNGYFANLIIDGDAISHFLIDEYYNSSSYYWYRLYSDGWFECGMKMSVTSEGQAFTLSPLTAAGKKFTDTNWYGIANGTQRAIYASIYSKTQTGFHVYTGDDSTFNSSSVEIVCFGFVEDA
jgi:hypothetical protein